MQRSVFRLLVLSAFLISVTFLASCTPSNTRRATSDEYISNEAVRKLFLAIRQGALEQVRQYARLVDVNRSYLDRAARIEGIGLVYPVPPLVHAIFGGDVRIVRALLDAGADPNREFSFINSGSGDNPRRVSQKPLFQIYYNYNLDIARVLVEAGADIESAQGSFPSRIYSKDVTGFTIYMGAFNRQGLSNRHTAEMYGKFARYLREQGANPFATNSAGDTALDVYLKFRRRQLANSEKRGSAQKKQRRSLVENMPDGKGRRYTGEVQDGKFNGLGILYLSETGDYPQLRGLFRDGELEGEAQLWLSPRERLAATVRDGRMEEGTFYLVQEKYSCRGSLIKSRGLLDHDWRISCPETDASGYFTLHVRNQDGEVRVSRSGWRREFSPQGDVIMAYQRDGRTMIKVPSAKSLEKRHAQIRSGNSEGYVLPERYGWYVWQLKDGELLAYRPNFKWENVTFLKGRFLDRHTLQGVMVNENVRELDYVARYVWEGKFSLKDHDVIPVDVSAYLALPGRPRVVDYQGGFVRAGLNLVRHGEGLCRVPRTRRFEACRYKVGRRIDAAYLARVEMARFKKRQKVCSENSDNLDAYLARLSKPALRCDSEMEQLFSRLDHLYQDEQWGKRPGYQLSDVLRCASRAEDNLREDMSRVREMASEMSRMQCPQYDRVEELVRVTEEIVQDKRSAYAAMRASAEEAVDDYEQWSAEQRAAAEAAILGRVVDGLRRIADSQARISSRFQKDVSRNIQIARQIQKENAWRRQRERGDSARSIVPRSIEIRIREARRECKSAGGRWSDSERRCFLQRNTPSPRASGRAGQGGARNTGFAARQGNAGNVPSSSSLLVSKAGAENGTKSADTEMEIVYEAIALCTEYPDNPDRIRWHCAGPTQTMSLKEPHDKSVSYSGCSKALGSGGPESANRLAAGENRWIYFCGMPLEPYHKDLVAEKGLSSLVAGRQKKYECPKTRVSSRKCRVVGRR